MNVIHSVIVTVLPYIISILEIMGILVVTWSGIKCFWEYIQNTFMRKSDKMIYLKMRFEGNKMLQMVFLLMFLENCHSIEGLYKHHLPFGLMKNISNLLDSLKNTYGHLQNRVGLILNQVNILPFFPSLDKPDCNNQGYCLSPPN